MFSSLPPSIPLALWPFITIAQQRFRKGRKNLQLQRGHCGNHSLPGMSHLQVSVTFSVLGKGCGEWEESHSSCLGRCSWQVFPWILCIPELFPDQVFHHGAAPAQASAEKHFPNCPGGFSSCPWKGNDSQRSKKLMIHIHLCSIVQKGIEGSGSVCTM